MEHLDTFLARYPPFDALPPDELQAVARAAVEREFDAGVSVLVEDGAPANAIWIVLSGSMELVHDGEVIQVLGPGETFGHPSLLTGMAPAFTVRARERCGCAQLAVDAARRVLGTLAGASYVASSMRGRLTRAGHTVHGLAGVGTTPVSAIMRPPVFCDPREPIRAVAARLSEQRGVSELLLALDDGRLGIVSDADIRGSLAHPLDAPVSSIARIPAPTVPAEQLAVEATVDMLAVGAEHLVVLDGSGVCGVLAAADLLGLDARSPIALRHTILSADSEDELLRATAELPHLFMALVSAGVPPRDVGRVLSLQHDALLTRLIDFSIAAHGQPPAAWTWLDLGSAARREFTLGSDQDNALAYDAAAEEVDGYFATLGADVNEGLERCGFGLDNNGVIAAKRLWRMSKADWERTFDECLSEPDESHLIRATVAFDFRPAAGGLEIAPDLGRRVRAARDRPAFMRLLARTAAGYGVALTFRGQLAADREGRLDLKRGATIPLVNLVRYHAIAAGVTISNTLERIDAVAAAGAVHRNTADALREAFDVIAKLRFERHAACLRAGHAPDNLIVPADLPPISRADLREALHVVRRAQKQLGVGVSPWV
ncbi:MAG: putative nucleotidyltransferase substrate binding domain-containing protein [Solirubrobacteraceae bacterium]